MFRPETLQQMLVMSTLIMCSFCDGYIFGQMSGMLSALRSEESDINISDEEISWIASIINVTCCCGFAVAVIIADRYGRRIAISLLSSPILLSWIMVYYAQSVTVIIISRVIVGICCGGVFFLSFITTAEYSIADMRGLCLNLVTSVGPSLGAGAGHILSTLLNWRTVALIGLAPSIISVLLPWFWVESPSWLASKGKFNECKTAFRMLNGNNNVTEQQLKLLIEIESLKRIKSAREKVSVFSRGRQIRSVMRKRYFWKLVLVSFVIASYRTAVGRTFFNTYAITILQDITGSFDVLLFTLLVDALIIIGSCLSCVLVNRMNMKPLLFSTGILAIVLLAVLSICLYFKQNNTLYFPWINSTLLGLYFIAVYSGASPTLNALCGEIFPMELKRYLLTILVVVNGVGIFLSLKLATQMLSLMGYHGVFLLNALISILCLIYLWITLPETKGRTLPEIELFFKNNTFDKANDLLAGEQMKVLV